MTTLKGKLKFLGHDGSWELDTPEGVVDLKALIFEVFEKFNGRRVTKVDKQNSFELYIDNKSPFILSFSGTVTVQAKSQGFGFSNTSYYLETTLQGLNGCEVLFFTGPSHVEIQLDPESKFTTVFFDRAKEYTPAVGKEFCTEPEVCAFMGVSSNGFECLKFGMHGRMILERLRDDTMNATRISNCVIGKKNEKPLPENSEAVPGGDPKPPENMEFSKYDCPFCANPGMRCLNTEKCPHYED